MSFISTLNWSNPLTYLFLIIIFIVVMSARFIINARKILKEAGVPMRFNAFSVDFNGLLKWSSVHQVKVGIIMLLILLLGIIYALSYGGA